MRSIFPISTKWTAIGNAQIPDNDGHQSTTTAEMPTATEGGDKEEESCDVAAPLPATAQLRRFDCHAEDTDKEVTGGNMDQDHAFKREN